MTREHYYTSGDQHAQLMCSAEQNLITEIREQSRVKVYPLNCAHFRGQETRQRLLTCLGTGQGTESHGLPRVGVTGYHWELSPTMATSRQPSSPLFVRFEEQF